MSHLYVELAKKAVERYIKKGEIVSPFNDLPPHLIRCGGLPKDVLFQRAGTFVTIMENGNLRGCIGTYLPTKNNVAEEIIHNAIAAATEDHRFGPIQEKELNSLTYVVYILSEPELVYPVKSREAGPPPSQKGGVFNGVKDLKELDPKKYGIIVKTIPITSPNGTDVVFNGHFVSKTGLLLPDLESVDTVEKQIAIACHKAEINPNEEKIFVYKFTVEKFQ